MSFGWWWVERMNGQEKEKEEESEQDRCISSLSPCEWHTVADADDGRWKTRRRVRGKREPGRMKYIEDKNRRDVEWGEEGGGVRGRGDTGRSKELMEFLTIPADLPVVPRWVLAVDGPDLSRALCSTPVAPTARLRYQVDYTGGQV